MFFVLLLVFFFIIPWLDPSVLYHPCRHSSLVFPLAALFVTKGGLHNRVYEHFLYIFLYYFTSVSTSHLLFLWFLSVAALENSVKSVITTLASPSFFTHLLTDLTTRSSLRSRAFRWSSVKMGLSGSRAKDSLITSLRRYSGCINSCSFSNVECLILQEDEYHKYNQIIRQSLKCFHLLLVFINFLCGRTIFLFTSGHDTGHKK